ncbi:MAG: hypothetical protein L3K08_04230 [Thermoplasmata archaeon]|nr:hypothetical protein [Thermoplasmata archaeon]
MTLQGGGDLIVTSGISGAKTLGEYAKAPVDSGLTDEITVYSPNGAGGLPENTATVWCGPAGRAVFPIQPGGVLTLKKVNPGLVALDDRGTSQSIYFVYGGPPDAKG